MKKIYIVTSISTHRLVYAIATDKDINNPDVRADLENNLPAHSELRQTWVGEHIDSISVPLTVDDFIERFDGTWPECKDLTKDEKLLSVEDYDNFTYQEKDEL